MKTPMLAFLLRQSVRLSQKKNQHWLCCAFTRETSDTFDGVLKASARFQDSLFGSSVFHYTMTGSNFNIELSSWVCIIEGGSLGYV